MSFNKFPWTNLHGFNLDWVIETVEYCKTKVDEFAQSIANISVTYVTKTELTNQRKLDDKANFTGTWWGDSKQKIDGEILNGQNLYQNVIDLIDTNPELNLEIFDGGFLASSTIPEVEDLGLITEAVTEEIDCGYFVYPCTCNI